MHSSVVLKRQQRQPSHNDINRLLEKVIVKLMQRLDYLRSLELSLFSLNTGNCHCELLYSQPETQG